MGPPPLPPGRFHGQIKTFSAKHGFGFIDCPRAYDEFKRDVFIHKQQMGDLNVGTDVTFEIRENKDGHPQARDVRRMDGARPGPYPGGDEPKQDDENKPKKSRRGKGRNRGKGKAAGKGDDGAAPAITDGAAPAVTDAPPSEGAAPAAAAAPAEPAAPAAAAATAEGAESM